MAKKATKKQCTALRLAMKDTLEKTTKKKLFGQLVQELAFGITSSKMFKLMKKIVPLKRVEIVKSSLVEGS